MATFEYAQATITVSNAQPGQKVSVQLMSQSGAQVLWSTGDPAKTGVYGINLNSTGGVALPVQSVTVAAQTMTILTSSESGGSSTLAFTVSTSLAAVESTSYFSISSASDPGVLVTFAFLGEQAVTLNQAPVSILWPDS